MDDYWIVVFQRPGDAALAYRDLGQHNCKVAMMPSPRELSASCGLSLRFSPQDTGKICACLGELFPEPERCRYFHACKVNGERRFCPLAQECPE